MDGFGPHLMLDGYGCEQAKLADLEHIYRVLDEFPVEIGMTKIMPPYVFKYSGARPEDWGVSGFVLIAESHISIHTFPEKRFLSLDIFSCKTFDVSRAVEIVTEAFGIQKVEQNLLDRGTEFPKDTARAAKLVRRDRARVAAEPSLPRNGVLAGNGSPAHGSPAKRPLKIGAR
jgi:S-adenosylmethionine decarboxylase